MSKCNKCNKMIYELGEMNTGDAECDCYGDSDKAKIISLIEKRIEYLSEVLKIERDEFVGKVLSHEKFAFQRVLKQIKEL
jgi:hypothetical protein